MAVDSVPVMLPSPRRDEVWITSGHLLLLPPTSLIIPGNAINGALSVINLAGMSLPA